MYKPVTFFQISDIHLLGDRDGALLGVRTQQSFEAVVELIKKEEAPDFILLTGDLSQDGSVHSYERIAAALKPLNVPIYWIAGNHDNQKTLHQVYPCDGISNHKHIVLKNWHLVLLNSQIPGAVEGFLDHAELTYLEHCLQTYPEHHAIVAFHHHPYPVGSAWLDKLGLKNADQLWETLAPYPHVNAVIFGHVHQIADKKIGHIDCFSAPATCIQFMPHQDHFGLEKSAPGFRIYRLFEEGRLESEVKRVAEYVGTFDVNAKGY